MSKKSKVAERAFARTKEKIAEEGSLESLMAPYGRWDLRCDGLLWTAFPVYERKAMGVGSTIREAVKSAIAKCSRGVKP